MPRKPNYSFEKRRKELERKEKKDARRAERLKRDQDESPADASPSDVVSPLIPGEESKQVE